MVSRRVTQSTDNVTGVQSTTGSEGLILAFQRGRAASQRNMVGLWRGNGMPPARRIQSWTLYSGCIGRSACQCPFKSVVEFNVFISSAFAQTAPAAAASGDWMSSLSGTLPLVLMFVVLYFVMIRPQMKKQKEHRAMIAALAKGDEVATAGGLLGKVVQLGEVYLTIELTPGVEVQLQRSAVIQVLPKGAINSSK